MMKLSQEGSFFHRLGAFFRRHRVASIGQVAVVAIVAVALTLTFLDGNPFKAFAAGGQSACPNGTKIYTLQDIEKQYGIDEATAKSLLSQYHLDLSTCLPDQLPQLAIPARQAPPTPPAPPPSSTTPPTITTSLPPCTSGNHTNCCDTHQIQGGTSTQCYSDSGGSTISDGKQPTP